ncbi:unnamed protein product [Closterium sp. Naga37s-1]|nr:unnamed protein product [Closterium sp. Naga37s-1]
MGRTRLAVSVIWTLDPSHHFALVGPPWFGRTVIRSNHQVTRHPIQPPGAGHSRWSHPLLDEHRVADEARERRCTHTHTHSTLLFHSPSAPSLPSQLSYAQAEAIADGVHPLPAEVAQHTHFSPRAPLPPFLSPSQLSYAQAQAIADGVHLLPAEHRLAGGLRELSYTQAQAIADGVHPLPAEHQLAGGQREVARAKTCIATLTAFVRPELQEEEVMELRGRMLTEEGRRCEAERAAEAVKTEFREAGAAAAALAREKAALEEQLREMQSREKRGEEERRELEEVAGAARQGQLARALELASVEQSSGPSLHGSLFFPPSFSLLIPRAAAAEEEGGRAITGKCEAELCSLSSFTPTTTTPFSLLIPGAAAAEAEGGGAGAGETHGFPSPLRCITCCSPTLRFRPHLNVPPLVAELTLLANAVPHSYAILLPHSPALSPSLLPVRCRPSDGRGGGRSLGAVPSNAAVSRAILLPHSPVPLLLLHSPLPCAHHQMNAVVAELMVLANAAVARKLTRAFPSTAFLRRHAPPRPNGFRHLMHVRVVSNKPHHHSPPPSQQALAASLAAVKHLGDPVLDVSSTPNPSLE